MLSLLSPELKQEVEDFVAFLLERHKQHIQANKFKLEWEGALEELNTEYDGLSLQNMAYPLREANDVSR